MNQIYVVCAQVDFLLQVGNCVGEPVAAFSDYPSALKYAESIFKNRLPAMPLVSGLIPKDLVFMITLTPTPIASAIVNTVIPAPSLI